MGSWIVLLPMMRLPDGASDMTVPDRVMAVPPCVSVVPEETMKPVGFAVKVWPATVYIAELGGDVGNGIVLPSITRIQEPKETGVPEIVIAEPPGIRVVPAIAISPDGPMLTICPAIVASGVGIGESASCIVLLPTTRPEGPSETGVPPTLIADAPEATL